MMEQFDKWISTLSLFEKWLVLYFYILLMIWVWNYDEKPEKENDKVDDKKDPGYTTEKPEKSPEPIQFNPERSNWFKIINPPQYELAVNKKEFIYAVVCWGLKNLTYEGVSGKKVSVDVEISYYPHKKMKGYFSSYYKKIMVYVNSHKTVEDLIDTSLHEVVHCFQYFLDKRNYEQKYAKWLKEKTYSFHPMEIEARKIASANTKDCKNYMIEQGKLRLKK